MPFFTSESVAIGHPDKVADQISDAILDACLEQDTNSKVACEALVTSNMIVLAGEITTKAEINYEKKAREVVKEIGYDNPKLGFDANKVEVLVSLHQQSPDIAMGVVNNEGAGDQGLMFGFATDETPSCMPLAIDLSHKIVLALNEERKKSLFIKPDGKTQVTIEYDEKGKPIRIDTVVLSVQHDEDKTLEEMRAFLTGFLKKTLPASLCDDSLKILINPTGRFVEGGPAADTGLTGRKIIVDSYGGYARHGGGAFSGKDATKVDRSAAYMARYLAKELVLKKEAAKVEIQIAYAIGVKQPVSLYVNTYGAQDNRKIEELIQKNYDLTPKGIIKFLKLDRPIYKKTAFGGHFGRPEFSWEQIL